MVRLWIANVLAAARDFIHKVVWLPNQRTLRQTETYYFSSFSTYINALGHRCPVGKRDMKLLDYTILIEITFSFYLPFWMFLKVFFRLAIIIIIITILKCCFVKNLMKILFFSRKNDKIK